MQPMLPATPVHKPRRFLAFSLFKSKSTNAEAAPCYRAGNDTDRRARAPSRFNPYSQARLTAPPETSSPAMTSHFHGLEPFPLFIDSAPPEAANYFSNMGSFKAVAPPIRRRPRISVPTKVSNYFYLRYYQYEVTFGLYMLNPREKVVMNVIICGIFAALLYALHVGLGPFTIRMFCRLLFYVTGSLTGGGERCDS